LLASKKTELTKFSFFSSSASYKVDSKAIGSDTVIIFISQVFFDAQDGGIKDFYARLSDVDIDTISIKAVTRSHPLNSTDVNFSEDIDEFQVVKYNGKEVSALDLKHQGKFVGWPAYFEITKNIR
jgi:hypothetical protein